MTQVTWDQENGRACKNASHSHIAKTDGEMHDPRCVHVHVQTVYISYTLQENRTISAHSKNTFQNSTNLVLKGQLANITQRAYANAGVVNPSLTACLFDVRLYKKHTQTRQQVSQGYLGGAWPRKRIPLAGAGPLAQRTHSGCAAV